MTDGQNIARIELERRGYNRLITVGQIDGPEFCYYGHGEHPDLILALFPEKGMEWEIFPQLTPHTVDIDKWWSELDSYNKAAQDYRKLIEVYGDEEEEIGNLS